jgi:hypothetical protein
MAKTMEIIQMGMTVLFLYPMPNERIDPSGLKKQFGFI